MSDVNIFPFSMSSFLYLGHFQNICKKNARIPKDSVWDLAGKTMCIGASQKHRAFNVRLYMPRCLTSHRQRINRGSHLKEPWVHTVQAVNEEIQRERRRPSPADQPLPLNPLCFCMQIPLVRIHLFKGSYLRERVYETKIVAFTFVSKKHLEC